MKPETERRIVERSARAYRWLLRAYPRGFRKRFGDEMALDFAECCREAVRSEGKRGLIKAWMSAILDLTFNAPASRLAADDSPTGERVRAVGSFLMLVGVQALLVVRVLVDPAPAEMEWRRLVALAIHSALTYAVSITLRRHARACLAVACSVFTALLIESVRTPMAWSARLGSPALLLFEALRISVPVTLVLTLVNLAPLFRTSAINEERIGSAPREP